MIKGILTDCVTGEVKEVDLEYRIVKYNTRRVFHLLNGITGYESFYIDKIGVPENHLQRGIELEEMRHYGWLACAGTKNKWDRLFIPGIEMIKALEGL